MRTRIHLWRILALLTLFAPAAAVAMPPLSREWCGTVTAVDAAERTLTVSDARGRPLALRWDERTRFVEGAQFTSAAAMSCGATVEVRYRSPLFGERYASKVVLLCSTPQNKPNKQNKP
jgi:hypothetical protein